MNLGLENRILASMDKHSVPGLSMTLIESGDIAWSKGFGVSSSESGDAVTSETVFEAASISKPVFA